MKKDGWGKWYLLSDKFIISHKQKIQEDMYDFPYHHIPNFEQGNFSAIRTYSEPHEYFGYMSYVISKINQIPFTNLLDVGCGDGKLVYELYKKIPAGVDGILSVSPYYNKPTQMGIIAHFSYLANCTNLPIILYNVPGRTSSNMTAETILELAKIPNVVAVKEASGDLDQIMEIVRLKEDE